MTIDLAAPEKLFGPVSIGVGLGLFLGKQIGVSGATWGAVRLGLGQRPEGVSWSQIYGAAVLAGIGFTMGLFVTALAFDNPVHAAAARLAILSGSAISAVVGSVVLLRAARLG